MGYLQGGCCWTVFKIRNLAWPGGLRLGAKNSARFEVAWARLAFAGPGPASVEPKVITRLAFVRLEAARLVTGATAT